MKSTERAQSATGEIERTEYSASHDGVQSIVDSTADSLAFAAEIVSTVGPDGLYDFRGRGTAEMHAGEIKGHVEKVCSILDAVVPRVDGSWSVEIEKRAVTISEERQAV